MYYLRPEYWEKRGDEQLYASYQYLEKKNVKSQNIAFWQCGNW